MIPVFRAKKIDSDEYIIGYLEEHNTNDFYISLMPNEIDSYKIDTSTLSIHFPDMIDSQRNKIFASLQKDGKGGDIVENYSFNDDYKSQISIYDNCKLCLVDKDGDTYCLSEIEYDGIKVIGIRE